MRHPTTGPGGPRIAAALRDLRPASAGRLAIAGAAAVVAASVLATGGCRCPAKLNPVEEPKPVVEAAPAVMQVAEHPDPFQRPDLPADWVWNGQALPTGDMETAVLTIEKWAPAAVSLNREYEYKVRVTNVARTMHVTDVVVTDELPVDGYEFKGAEPAADLKAGALRWTFDHLAPGESREITVRGRATEVGTLTKCASVEYTPHVCIRTAVVAPALELTRSAPSEVVMCDDVPLKYVVRNTGSGDAVGVKLTDQLPEGLTVAGSRALALDVGTLKAGESRELTAVARALKVGRFVSTAEVVGAGDLRAEAQATVVVRRPKLEIAAEAASETALLGRDSVFRITVKNTGDCAAKDFVLRDAFTGAERIVAASDGGTVAGSEVVWNLGTIAAGATRTVTVTVNRTAEGLVSDAAQATAYCAEAVRASAKTAYRGVPAVLVEVVDDADPLPIGTPTTYTVTVTNQGTAADSDVVVTCTFEDAVEFVSADGATKATRSGSKVTFAALPRLAPKEAARWTVTVRGLKAADSRFKVTVDTAETERPIEETEATRVFRLDF